MDISPSVFVIYIARKWTNPYTLVTEYFVTPLGMAHATLDAAENMIMDHMADVYDSLTFGSEYHTFNVVEYFAPPF